MKNLIKRLILEFLEDNSKLEGDIIVSKDAIILETEDKVITINIVITNK